MSKRLYSNYWDHVVIRSKDILSTLTFTENDDKVVNVILFRGGKPRPLSYVYVEIDRGNITQLKKVIKNKLSEKLYEECTNYVGETKNFFILLE